MIELSRGERKSTVLTPSSLGCLTRAATVNVTAGCALGCIYCYAPRLPPLANQVHPLPVKVSDGAEDTEE